jgi:CHAT domain-containing protein
MKRQYHIPFSFLCLFIIGCFYLFNAHKKNKINHFDKHIIDAIHVAQINTFFEEADALKYAQDYPNARIVFENLLPKAKSVEDSLYTYNQLIYSLLSMNEDSLAAKSIQQFEQHFPTIEKRDPSVLADYFYNKGVLNYRIFHPKNANIYLKKSLNYIHEVYGNNHLKEAQCLSILGLLHTEFMCAPDSAFIYLPKAYSIFQKNKNILSGWSADCLLGMSIISRYKRQYDEAAGYSEEAINILNKQPFPNYELMARCLVDKARAVNMRQFKTSKIEDKQRIHREVEAYFEKSVAICPKYSARLQECYHFWTRQYARIDTLTDPQKTQHFWQTFAQLEQTIAAQKRAICGFPNQLKGIYFDNQKQLNNAIYFNRESMKTALIDSTFPSTLFIENCINLAHLYENLARKLKDAKPLDSALYFMKINTIKYAGFDDFNMPWTALIKPEFYSKTALQFVSLGYESKLFLQKYALKKDDESLNMARELAKITDNMLFTGLTSQDDDAFDYFQTEAAESVYSVGIQSSALFFKKTKDEKYLNDVFYFGERVRSFLLYRDADTRDSTAAVPRQSLKDSIRQIESAINILKLATERGENTNIKLMEKQNIREALFKQLKADFPAYYKSKIAQPIPNIKTVQKELKPNQLFIQYTFSDSILNILCINQKNIYCHQIPWNDSMVNKLNRFCQNLNDEKQTKTLSPEEYAHLGFELYQKLLPQRTPQYKSAFLAFEACEELIISPDRELNLLPFEALVETNQAVNYKSMPYLVHRFPITYAPSWKMYNINSKINLPKEPYLKAYTYAFESKELRSAETEMANISRIFPQKSSIAKGQFCSKNAFNSDTIDAYDILHLSLHAESDPLSKLNNKIYFAPKFQESVYGFDLLKRPFREKLVVLSACKSAYGITKKGEGAYTLSRIFLRLGVPRVVASLWSINDSKTAQITTFFYENLVFKQFSPTQSLQKAKLQYLKSADSFTAQPRFWAGLVCLD